MKSLSLVCFWLLHNFLAAFFDFVKKLGAGSFGEVHVVIDKSSRQERVIKIINKRQTAVPIHQINVSRNREVDYAS